MPLQENVKEIHRMKVEDIPMSDVNHLAGQISEVKEDMREIRTSMKQIADAVTRLAVLEQQNKSTDQRMEQIETRQMAVERESAETRLSMIKLTAQISGATTTIRVLWIVLGAGVIGAITKFFN